MILIQSYEEKKSTIGGNFVQEMDTRFDRNKRSKVGVSHLHRTMNTTIIGNLLTFLTSG
jgi:hypothetical protein